MSLFSFTFNVLKRIENEGDIKDYMGNIFYKPGYIVFYAECYHYEIKNTKDNKLGQQIRSTTKIVTYTEQQTFPIKSWRDISDVFDLRVSTTNVVDEKDKKANNEKKPLIFLTLSKSIELADDGTKEEYNYMKESICYRLQNIDKCFRLIESQEIKDFEEEKVVKLTEHIPFYISICSYITSFLFTFGELYKLFGFHANYTKQQYNIKKIISSTQNLNEDFFYIEKSPKLFIEDNEYIFNDFNKYSAEVPDNNDTPKEKIKFGQENQPKAEVGDIIESNVGYIKNTPVKAVFVKKIRGVENGGNNLRSVNTIKDVSNEDVLLNVELNNSSINNKNVLNKTGYLNYLKKYEMNEYTLKMANKPNDSNENNNTGNNINNENNENNNNNSAKTYLTPENIILMQNSVIIDKIEKTWFPKNKDIEDYLLNMSRINQPPQIFIGIEDSPEENKDNNNFTNFDKIVNNEGQEVNTINYNSNPNINDIEKRRLSKQENIELNAPFKGVLTLGKNESNSMYSIPDDIKDLRELKELEEEPEVQNVFYFNLIKNKHKERPSNLHNSMFNHFNIASSDIKTNTIENKEKDIKINTKDEDKDKDISTINDISSDRIFVKDINKPILNFRNTENVEDSIDFNRIEIDLEKD